MSTHLSWPADPVKAVIHPDPFPYYDSLTGRPPWHDELTGSWVVAAAADVAAVLDHRSALVRPHGHAVPPQLVSTAAGELFGRLVRIRDDAGRERLREAIVGTIQRIAADDRDTVCSAVATDVWIDRFAQSEAITEQIAGQILDEWMRLVPIAMLARLCGLPSDDLASLVDAARALAACFAPGAAENLATAASAAVDTLIDASRHASSTGIAALVIDALTPNDVADAYANIAGLFFQTFDATAGLIGSAITKLPTSRTAGQLVGHLLSVEPPVHNTRRFVADDLEIGGVHMSAGDEVLVLLVAAARDSTSSKRFAFGHGRHQCPASTLAATMAEHALGPLIEHLGDHVPTPTGFIPSRNVRIPTFSR